jgi:(p)ppGpp synthase/HD superfamily hydrolase
MSDSKKKIPPRFPAAHRLSGALELACSLHNEQPRKGGDIPYISHLMAVSALVMDHGGTEDQAIAALLHDSLEDTGATFTSLCSDVGDKVAQIVRDCSDTEEDKPENETIEQWWERKSKYLAKVASKLTDDPSLLVALADKVHNAEATVADLKNRDLDGRKAFVAERFNAGWDCQEKWYSGLVEVFATKIAQPAALPLVDRLRTARNEIFSIDPTKGTR